MNRRDALKNLSLGLGYAVATPTIMSILNSCTEKVETWTPLFLSKTEKHMVTMIADLILPTSDTPGALDVNIPQFIDKIYHKIETKQNQQVFKQGAEFFSKNFIQTLHKNILEGKEEDFAILLDNYLNLSKDESKNILKEQKSNLKSISKTKLESYALYKFLLSVRYYTIFGYITSEKIGQEVLAYDPVPGVYQGCISLEEATQGRAWSL